MTTMHCPICGTTMSSNNCEEGNDHRYVHRDIGDYYRFGDLKTGYWIDFIPVDAKAARRPEDRDNPKDPNPIIEKIRLLEAVGMANDA